MLQRPNILHQGSCPSSGMLSRLMEMPGIDVLRSRARRRKGRASPSEGQPLARQWAKIERMTARINDAKCPRYAPGSRASRPNSTSFWRHRVMRSFYSYWQAAYEAGT